MEKQNLYEIYGKLVIEQEILSSKINEVKKAIANSLNENNKKAQKEAKKEEEKK